MAPQATPVTSPTTAQSSTISSAPTNGSHDKPFIPVALLVFLGLCLAYTFSYFLYRIVISRRLRSKEDAPESSDRGISQFMNGARLTLNLTNHRSSPLTLVESPPNVLDEGKPLTDPGHTPNSEVPANSPGDTPSTPFTVLMPSFTFTMHPNEELSQLKLQEEPGSTEARTMITTPAPVQPRFSQRIANKVKILSRDRAEAIALDPKLAPVQGPLRPLSMVPNPSREKRTLFGLGFKHIRGYGGDSEVDPAAR